MKKLITSLKKRLLNTKKKKPMATVKSNSKVTRPSSNIVRPDQPIDSDSADYFERKDFCKVIGKYLVVHDCGPSIAVSLESPWGTGKSSAVNLIRKSLHESHPEIIIVHFNPWLIGELDSVIEGFFLQFASSISLADRSKEASNTAEKVLKMAKFLGPIKLIPGVEPWGTLVEKTISAVGEGTKSIADLSEINIEKRKEEVQDAVEKLKKPIVVIIDDIDRLPPEEIRIIFQLVKAVGNFKGVSYLLAFDPKPVMEALSFGGVYSGKDYLEKIVQLNFSLPRISYIHKKDFIERLLEDLHKIVGIEFSGKYEEESIAEAIRITARVLGTPREITRLINKYRLAIELLKNEVYSVDLLVYEVLDLKYPLVTEYISKNPQQFVESNRLNEDPIQDMIDIMSHSDEKKEESPKAWAAYKIYNDSETDNIKLLFGFLFPQIEKEYGKDRKDNVFRKRVNTRDAMLKLLHKGTPNFAYSAKEAILFLTSVADRDNIISEQEKSGSIEYWLYYLEEFVERQPIVDMEDLFSRLFKLASNIFKKRKENICDAVSHFTFVVVENLRGEEVQYNLLSFIAKNEISLSASHEIVLQLCKEKNVWDNGVFKGISDSNKESRERTLVTPEQTIAIAKQWVEVVEKQAKDIELLKDEPEAIGILFRWGQLSNNEYGRVHDYVREITKETSGLQTFVELFDEGKGLSGIEKILPNKNEFVEMLDKFPEYNPLVWRMKNHLKGITKEE